MSTNIKKRRTQERTEITRAKLLDAATRIFSEQGYEGVSIRELEKAAEVQRGLLVYHFTDKAALWKAAADRTFGMMNEEVSLRADILRDLSRRDRIATLIRFYARFSARHPEFSRLLSQEGRQDSWRIRYLVDNHIGPMTRSLRKPVTEVLGLDEQGFMHWFYMLAGASATIFSHAPECRVLFDTDSLQESVVERHADLMVKMLMGAFEK